MAIRKVISRSILDGTVAAVDLGGAATNLSVNGILSAGAISTSIASTAYDIFVYDTSKDTDSGAWRKRTSHTSWYNETLNTATRGSRRDFPSVAVIVSTTTTVTIYDGDDPAMPMWMVINANGIIDWPTSTHTRIMVTAANGQLAVASEDGVEIFNFVRDYVDLAYSGYYNVTTSRTIAGRNDVTAYTSGAPATANMAILLTYACYCISSAVIPNSYVDPTTGLPNPTFAIGHGAGSGTGGISIIQADRSVLKTASGTYKVWKININPDRSVYAAQSNASDSNWGYLMKKDYASLNGIDYQTYANWDYYYNYAGTGAIPSAARLDYNYVSVLPQAAAQGGTFGGVTLNAENRNSPANGMVAYINQYTNTGWMHGQCKLATLLSKTAGTCLASEMVAAADSNYTSSKGGWTSQASATSTWVSTGGVTDAGCVALTSTGASNVYSTILMSGSLTVGQKYNFRVAYKTSSAATTNLSISNSQSNSGGTLATVAASGSTSYQYWTVQFTAQATSAYFNVYTPSATTYVDDLSLTVATESDWSQYQTAIAPVGTVTKTAAVSNTDVMAYSGWSASNYMFLPYQSWMNIGNGPFSISTWVKMNDNTSQSCLLYCTNYRGEADYWFLEQQTNGDWRFQIDRYESAVVAMNNNIGTQWRHIVAVYVDTELKLYIDGVQVASNGVANARFGQYTGSTTQTVDVDADSSSGLYIGRRDTFGAAQAFNGSVAMLRISASAPDAAQVWKMFNDEKHLFSPGTSVVTYSNLYGTSDAVTAMAYDPDTKLLHVGTSSGRSTFSGLRRVSNTTTAVTTAISAVNGLVAEQ